MALTCGWDVIAPFEATMAFTFVPLKRLIFAAERTARRSSWPGTGQDKPDAGYVDNRIAKGDLEAP